MHYYNPNEFSFLYHRSFGLRSQGRVKTEKNTSTFFGFQEDLTCHCQGIID